MSDLSETALEVMLAAIRQEDVLGLKPTKLLVHPWLFQQALRLLRGPHWHHKITLRWRYLQRRGARP